MVSASPMRQQIGALLVSSADCITNELNSLSYCVLPTTNIPQYLIPRKEKKKSTPARRPRALRTQCPYCCPRKLFPLLLFTFKPELFCLKAGMLPLLGKVRCQLNVKGAVTGNNEEEACPHCTQTTYASLVTSRSSSN
eukprot:82905-Pelagomonas_calceolata.AAC.1